MKIFLKSYWKYLLFFGFIGLFGGYFTGIYLYDMYPAEMIQEIESQGITKELLGVVSAIQSLGYGIILGALGIFLSKKIGLWKDEFTIGNGLKEVILVSIIGGCSMILFDLFLFNQFSQAIADSYLVKPTLSYVVASVMYGGVIEEVMLRLFFMSLIAFALNVVFNKNKEISNTILIIANVISAILFASGHLPATIATIGLSPMILFRCFLLNGGIGLLFGRLYRKYGISASMFAHAGCHIVSKFIWILFV